ncbi:molybdopterin-dependent oxidoreductase [Streptomyces bohaiensis]|uniref:Molybdopterin-dependent oxidoreductase n=1 Tax=Streptomyces bohaiensis TaxID=1431344 RepID=A0ABX1C7W8_9ACTN|nr:molybdopterin-dependent oxidoreductase [Streptomyces bohaiensis]NJQ15256.1 molybdopterin-dependent oxidoreductase [Streptomyces bohaiensis]
MLAAAAALAVAELFAGLVRPEARPVTAVGGAVIDRTPIAVKDWAIRTFGTADKLVLQIGILTLLALFAVAVGLLALRSLRAGAAGAALFGVFGAVTAAGRPGGSAPDAVPSLVGGVAAVVVIVLLVRTLRPGGPPAGSEGPEDAPAAAAATDRGVLSALDRRRFLRAASVAAAASAGSGLLGNRLLSTGDAEAEAARDSLTIPRPGDPAPALPPGADLEIDGLAPFTTPNKDFYRVDTALRVPRLDATAWRMRIFGRGVECELELSYRDLLDRELIERDITLTCVSNQVGGPYVGNARWIGVPLAPLLREAGVRPPSEGGPADQLVARSVEGMTLGSPVDTVMDGRDAMLAVGMNGEPLPFRNGFPVRMVVPGLYGYVSACKWLSELELTTFDDFDVYWVERDWAVRAPVKTMSRIDTPRGFATIPAGTVPVAGVAWAQHTGIDGVEVRVDGGEWREARLAPAPSDDTWRQWVWEWEAEPGSHRLEVRATDSSGETQTEERVGTVPDGATGWHSVVVTVD